MAVVLTRKSGTGIDAISPLSSRFAEVTAREAEPENAREAPAVPAADVVAEAVRPTAVSAAKPKKAAKRKPPAAQSEDKADPAEPPSEHQHQQAAANGESEGVQQSILVVDDEEDLLELVRYNLTKDGYRVSCVSSGEEALKSARKHKPDLIVLDLMLPAVDGLEVCRRLKGDSKTRDIPIIMLTARSEESDMVLGLERGADDYITKPFSPRVLTARVRALLRRREAERTVERETTIEVRELSIHPGRHEASLAGKPLELTYTEFALLLFLAKRPGWAFTRSQIVDAVKGEDYPVTERSVDVQVAGLRKKLGRFGSYIETVRGVGYRFRA